MRDSMWHKGFLMEKSSADDILKYYSHFSQTICIEKDHLGGRGGVEKMKISYVCRLLNLPSEW